MEKTLVEKVLTRLELKFEEYQSKAEEVKKDTVSLTSAIDYTKCLSRASGVQEAIVILLEEIIKEQKETLNNHEKEL